MIVQIRQQSFCKAQTQVLASHCPIGEARKRTASREKSRPEVEAYVLLKHIQEHGSSSAGPLLHFRYVNWSFQRVAAVVRSSECLKGELHRDIEALRRRLG